MHFAIKSLNEFNRTSIFATRRITIVINDITNRIHSNAIEMEIVDEIIHRTH